MHTRFVFAGGFVLAWLGVFAGRAQAIVAGQIDTFSSGAQNWATGASGNPSVTLGGGPGGATDPFLQLVSDGSGPSGRLIEFNRAQWLGDYVAAGVTSIEMDITNIGSTPLDIRIAFKDTQGFGGNGYASTTSFSLVNDGLWHHVAFGLSASDLTAVGSPTPLGTFLTNPQEFRILSSSSPALNGDFLMAKLGVDNVTAVPAPAGALCVGLGALVASRRRRTR
ncbi:MAG TPA: hypothetical protein VHC70_04205 [Phycisphaerales bacterium]|nr:hypothetical protein [Phycisphaerales bacterium]